MKVDDLLRTSILNCKQHELYTESIVLDDTQEKIFADMKVRFESGEPVQYILGKWGFCDLTLKCDQRALVPRPETEILVEQALKVLKKDATVLNIGVGTGNVEIALADKLPFACLKGVEVSADAVDLARENVSFYGCQDRVEIVHQDINDFFGLNSDIYDLIISNPPYIPTADLEKLPEDVKREPRIALDGGEDGLNFYRVIIANAAQFLKPNGYLMFECGDGQSFAIADLIQKTNQFKSIEFVKDYVGTERIVIAERNNG